MASTVNRKLNGKLSAWLVYGRSGWRVKVLIQGRWAQTSKPYRSCRDAYVAMLAAQGGYFEAGEWENIFGGYRPPCYSRIF